MKIFIHPETGQSVGLTDEREIEQAETDNWKEAMPVETSIDTGRTVATTNAHQPLIDFHTKASALLQENGFLDVTDVLLASLLGENVDHVLDELRRIRDERNNALKK